MLAHTKERLIKISIGKKEFKIPKKEAKAVETIIRLLKEKLDKDKNVSSEVVYKEFNKNRPKGAVYLKGIRTREALSQKALEKMTGIPVTNISKYENGSRKITEAAAKKLAKALNAQPELLLRK